MNQIDASALCTPVRVLCEHPRVARPRGMMTPMIFEVQNAFESRASSALAREARGSSSRSLQ